jgi:hypothetical protein
MEGCLELFPFTEGHAGEFFLETFLLFRVAGAQQAVHELEEALFVLRHRSGPDQGWRGFSQRRPLKRAKSVSHETSTASWLRASAFSS